MPVPLTDLKQIISLRAIPNGRYSAEWSGYVVRFLANGNHYLAGTGTGIRGTASATVTAENGVLSVEVNDAND